MTSPFNDSTNNAKITPECGGKEIVLTGDPKGFLANLENAGGFLECTLEGASTGFALVTTSKFQGIEDTVQKLSAGSIKRDKTIAHLTKELSSVMTALRSTEAEMQMVKKELSAVNNKSDLLANALEEKKLLPIETKKKYKQFHHAKKKARVEGMNLQQQHEQALKTHEMSDSELMDARKESFDGETAAILEESHDVGLGF